MHYNISTMLKRPKQIRRGEGRVHNQGAAMPLGDGGYRIQIRDVQRGVADGLHVQGARPPVDGGFHLVKILRLHEACGDPELGQDVVEQGECSAVQVVRRDDFVPCFARLTIVEKMADVPDAEANAPTPPSNRLIRSSSMACVGLPSRP